MTGKRGMTMKQKTSWEVLVPYLAKQRRLTYLGKILYYDTETICPEKSISYEASAMNLILSQSASISQNPFFIDAVRRCCKDKTLTPMQKEVVEARKKNIDFMSKISMSDFLQANNDIRACNEMWRKYKPLYDFASWLPYFEKCVYWVKFEADLKKTAKQKCRYDAVLDGFEPGETVAYVDSVFEPLKAFLIKKLAQVKTKNKATAEPDYGIYDDAAQRKLGLALLKEIGYDLASGYLGTSPHGFSDNLAPHDARITTKFTPSDWRSSALTCLHEGGHCIEFQNWNDEEYANYADGMETSAIAETHSRFYENLIGRSIEFVASFRKIVAANLDGKYAKLSDQQFYDLFNRPKATLIRTESDELTYSLHIIIRYEIEKALINDEITCAQIPALWNAKYKEYLGLEVPSDAEGCMQDIHWSEGSFGYFPSYALGNIYGAQIKNVMEKKIGLNGLVRKGDFETIRKWFAENDFAYDWMKPNDWIVKVTGEPADSKYFIAYLNQKY